MASAKERTDSPTTSRALNSLMDVNNFSDFFRSSNKISQQLKLNDSFNLKTEVNMKKFLVLTAAVFMSGMMYAESVSCTNENGKCEFFEDGSYECQCSDESPFGGTGVAGSPSDEEVTMPTNEECLAMVDEMCGIPEGSVTCENPAGKCFVYPDGTYFCNCLDGSGEGGGSSEPGDPGVDPEETDPGVDTPVEGEGDSSDGSDTTEPEMTCSQDLDCPVDYICDEGICEPMDDTPDVDPETCVENKDCPENYICVEGVCEFNGEIEMPVCEDVLVEVCGTEAPDLKKICTEESLPYCTESHAAYNEKCGISPIPEDKVEELLAGTWNEYASDVAGCCRGYETEKVYFDELLTCLETKSCEECFGEYEEAVGKGGNETGDSGDTGSVDDTADSGNTGDTEASFEDDAADTSNGSSGSSGCSAVNI